MREATLTRAGHGSKDDWYGSPQGVGKPVRHPARLVRARCPIATCSRPRCEPALEALYRRIIQSRRRSRNWRLPLPLTPSARSPQPPTDHGSAVPARKHAMNDQEHHARRNGVIVSHGWHQNDQGILGLAVAYSFGLVTLRCSREIAPAAPPYRPPPTGVGRFAFVGKGNDRPLRPST